MVVLLRRLLEVNLKELNFCGDFICFFKIRVEYFLYFSSGNYFMVIY